jgi:multiple sugar transport system ATP-binding protein
MRSVERAWNRDDGRPASGHAEPTATGPREEHAAASSAAAVRLNNVTKVYRGDVRAVDSVSLDVRPGEFIALVGPSGCGKSSILRMIAGLEVVSQGEIWINDRNVTDWSPKDRDVAMVFQNYALFSHMSVRQNLTFGLRARHAPRGEIARLVGEVVESLGLDGLLERRPSALSGGQQQRVAMGRAMVRQPAVYLMDEPLSNLDAKLRSAVRTELARTHKRLGTTTVFVTHDQVEAMTLGQRVVVLGFGTIQQCATPREVFKAPANLFVAGFIGWPTMNFAEVRWDGKRASVGGRPVPVPAHVAGHMASDGRVILGLRPEDIRLARSDADYEATWTVPAEVVEDLGNAQHLVFALDAERVVTDGLAATGAATGDLLVAGEEALFTAALASDPVVTPGENVRVGFSSSDCHFFDVETSLAITHESEDQGGHQP